MKKLISILAAVACISAMSAVTVFADSEEFNGEEPDRPAISDESGDSNVEDGDWEELGDGDSIFDDEDTKKPVVDESDITDSTVPSVPNNTTTETTPVTPVTEVTPTDKTPGTGNATPALISSVAGIVAGAVGCISKKKLK